MRSAEDLIDRISEERIWRVKEIIIVTGLSSRRGISPIETEFYCRAGATLFYAHWEGFVKRAATYYVRHISMQRIKICEMADFVLEIYMAQILRKSDARVKSDLGKRLIFRNEERPKLDWKNVVATDSNLSSVVFRRIIDQLGLDANTLAVRDKKIDHLILKTRNEISHGEKGTIDVKMLEELSQETRALISTFGDAIENAAVLRSYCR